MIIKDDILMSIFWGLGLAVNVIVKQILSFVVLGSQTGASALSQRLGVDYTLADRVKSVCDVIIRACSDKVVVVLLFAIFLEICYLSQENIKKRYGVLTLLFIAVYPCFMVFCSGTAQYAWICNIYVWCYILYLAKLDL